jgi:tRNA threonylcarbamoyladenosine biosynthesis protein TsaE
MAEQSKIITLTSPEHSCDMARTLAARLGPGQVILLEGDIGAGKTHFARCLIQSLIGEDEDVPSPTFTLVQAYDAEEMEIWHADLYRLSSPDEVVELGLLDAFEDALCLVEWPDRLAELQPENALRLSLSMTETEGHRQAVFQWSDEVWTKIIDAVLP